jgi:hypothetical protein
MNSEDLKAAVAKDFRARLAAEESAPQWRDKPTCAGLWLFDTDFGIATLEISDEDVADTKFHHTCFGPIPERPVT